MFLEHHFLEEFGFLDTHLYGPEMESANDFLDPLILLSISLVVLIYGSKMFNTSLRRTLDKSIFCCTISNGNLPWIHCFICHSDQAI